MVAPQPAAPITPRASLETSRSEGGIAGSLSPGRSRTGSVLTPTTNDGSGLRPGGGAGAAVSMEELLLREARKTETRTA